MINFLKLNIFKILSEFAKVVLRRGQSDRGLSYEQGDNHFANDGLRTIYFERVMKSGTDTRLKNKVERTIDCN